MFKKVTLPIIVCVNYAKYYIDYTMKHSSNSINAFCYERDDGGLDEVAIRYIENICNYIVKGIQ